MAKYRSIDENHFHLEFPDVHEHGAFHIIVKLMEIGLMSSNGMGPIPLSWLEIDAWMRVTEATIPMWERTMLKRLSEEYVAELSHATDVNRPAPYTKAVEVEELDRPAIAFNIMNVLRGFKRNKPPVEDTEEDESPEG